MSARSKARKAALDILYESDIRKIDPQSLLELRSVDNEYRELTTALIARVSEHRGRIDELISIYAKSWDTDRMPVIDRNILRLAISEILWSHDTPAPVAIDEAVELAKTLSTDGSSAYINGVLRQILEIKGELSL